MCRHDKFRNLLSIYDHIVYAKKKIQHSSCRCSHAIFLQLFPMFFFSVSENNGKVSSFEFNLRLRLHRHHRHHPHTHKEKDHVQIKN